jgi:two-component system LytT family response regulator
MTVYVLVVDDEPLARTRIVKQLRQTHPDWTIAEAMDGPDALAHIETRRPDILILDIEMPEMDGFSVVQHLGENPPKVIFQTAYDQYAVKAFEACACDYILKPFSDERLETAISKALTARMTSVPQLQIHLVNDQNFMRQFVVNVGNRRKIIAEDEVLYFLSTDHTTRIFMHNGVDYAYEFSLSYLEPKLDPTEFIRTHRNCIVRFQQIGAIDRGPNAHVTLKNGAVLPLSRERRKALLARFAAGST